MKYTKYREYLERTAREELGIHESPKESKWVWAISLAPFVALIGWIIIRG